MKVIRFDGLYQKTGWLCPAFVTIDSHGIIQKISDKCDKSADQIVEGHAIPSFHNAHSHAFQYAMAGMAEFQAGNTTNNFWSWRESMYRLALKLQPEEVQVIAKALYLELASFGYTSVTEFHYLHHQPNGSRYNDPLEISRNLTVAAQQVGIDLTIVPVYYQNSDFNKPALDEQRRFTFKGSDDYLNFTDSLKTLEAKESSASAKVSMGLGIHSLRAASMSIIQDIAAATNEKRPLHIHIAEQIKEVDACLAFCQKRPVEYLFENIKVDENWHLVHATHVTAKEIESILRAQANVVLCPTTEANLGDGIFPLQNFHKNKGRWTIGSDSHVSRDPLEELRWLDYGQRLNSLQRNPLCYQDGSESGHELLISAVENGKAAAGLSNHQFFQAGTPLDAIVFGRSETVFSLPKEKRLSALIFAHPNTEKLGTMKNGNWLIDRGLHPMKAQIQQQYHQLLTQLFA